MIFTIENFCRFVSNDLSGLIRTLESETSRNVTLEEKEAWQTSYPVVSGMLASAMKKNPKLGKAHISLANLLLEYKLPGASSWCDVILLGKNESSGQVVILELKDYIKNYSDRPGMCEGLMIHRGKEILHPSDQVRGYAEYCQNFHSAVVEEKARVNGCVYFTRNIDMRPYTQYPNDRLTKEYPMYNRDTSDALAEYIADKIKEPDLQFLGKFVNGYYKQDRNILKQVAENLKLIASTDQTARPFVLLQEQRTGLYKTMTALGKALKSGKKQVIIVEGPPGSGKSAVAINLWIEAALKYRQKGNVVYVTTSGSQNDNWEKTFQKYTKVKGVIVAANSFNPGMDGTKMKRDYLPVFSRTHPEYLFWKNDKEQTLRYDLYKTYLKYMQEHKLTRNYKENLHYLSIVDEAHALINPTASNFKSNKSAGWCVQMGPQGWHIINESLVTVFFTDSKQSFRDNETTSTKDLMDWSEDLGAEITIIQLKDQQFRCGGSVEYVEWLEKLFSTNPINNHALWKKKFEFKMMDYPSEVDDYLRSKNSKSIRILSSYTETWVSNKLLDKMHTRKDVPYDFDIPDKNRRRWKRYWNYGEDKCYDIYVQGRIGSMMYIDPLCEVGCAYTVRGFDYDYVGVLWLDDIVRRGDKWIINSRKNQETAIEPTRKRALEEQAMMKHMSTSNLTIKRIPDALSEYIVKGDGSDPFTKLLFDKIVNAYRILLTRGIKGACLYIQDKETRDYVKKYL